MNANLFEAFDDDVNDAPTTGDDTSSDYRGRLMTSAAALSYIVAGKATVTLVSTRTGKSFTYRCTKSEDGGAVFIGVLTGPDNSSDYSYLGRIARSAVAGDRFWAGRKVPRAGDVGSQAPSAKAFDWAFRAMSRGEMPDGLEVWHESRCGRCGLKLTRPESIGRGFGPECYAKLA